MKFSDLRQRFREGISSTKNRENGDPGFGDKVARKPGTRLIYTWTREDYCRRFSELLITIEGYDRVFAQQITIHNSYTYEEMEWNARFLPI